MNIRSIFKPFAVAALAAVMLLSACGGSSAPAGTGNAGSITIKDAWVRAALITGSEVQSAGYMTIDNTGSVSDTLLSVSSNAAEVIEMHESEETDGMKGMMSMQPLPNGLDIPAHGSVIFKPGSFHLMIMKAKKEAFTPGRTIKLSFKFKSGTELALDVPVRENN